MRIAIANRSRRWIGGAETYLRAVIPALAAEGHELALFSEIDEPDTRPPLTADPTLPEWSVAGLGAARSLAGLAAWSPDVLYAHIPVELGLERQLLRMAPAVFFAHGYFGSCISGARAFKNPTVRPCPRPFGPLCLAHYYPHRCGGLNPLTMLRDYRRESERLENLSAYRAVVTHSEHVAMVYRRQGLRDVRLIPFCLPKGEVGADRPAVATPPLDTVRLLFLGRMEVLKGGQALLEALPLVRSALQRPVDLVFAGDGPSRESWQSRAAELEAADPALRISFPGWVDEPTANGLFMETHLLVVPSMWPEPFGLVGPEAGLHGVPAAAFDVGGIGTWLREGVNGALARGERPSSEGLAQAIERCLSDAAVYRRLREGARAEAGRFTMRAHLGGLLQVLEDARSAPLPLTG